jgi:hypothetical protein
VVAGSIICAGPTLSLPSRGCSSLPQPMLRPVDPLGGEPPTGEPYAGDPHVRFGGGSGRVTGCSYPYHLTPATDLEPLPAEVRPGRDAGP